MLIIIFTYFSSNKFTHDPKYLKLSPKKRSFKMFPILHLHPHSAGVCRDIGSAQCTRVPSQLIMSQKIRFYQKKIEKKYSKKIASK